MRLLPLSSAIIVEAWGLMANVGMGIGDEGMEAPKMRRLALGDCSFLQNAHECLG